MPRSDSPRNARPGMDREGVRQSALPASQRTTTLAIPEGFKLFFPTEKNVEHVIRIMPYQVTKSGHPDRKPVGAWFYRRPYGFHPNLGGSGRTPVCPRVTWGQRCAACEKADALRADGYDKNKVAIKNLKPKLDTIYVCFDPHKPDEFLIFDWASSKFAETLEKEISMGGEKYLDFAQADGGLMVKFRVVEDTFVDSSGHTRPFITCDKVDFVDARQFTNLTDAQIARLPHLDDIIIETPYDEIYDLLNGADPAPPAADPAAPEVDTAAPATPPNASVKDEWDNPPPTAAPTAPPAAETETPPEPPANAVKCKACRGSGKSSKGSPCVPCDGNGWVVPPEAEPAPAAATPPPAAPASKTKRRAEPAPAAATPPPAAAAGVDEFPQDW